MRFGDRAMKTSPGQILVITKGEYDDYGIAGIVEVLEGFDSDEQADRFCQDCNSWGGRFESGRGHFM